MLAMWGRDGRVRMSGRESNKLLLTTALLKDAISRRDFRPFSRRTKKKCVSALNLKSPVGYRPRRARTLWPTPPPSQFSLFRFRNLPDTNSNRSAKERKKKEKKELKKKSLVVLFLNNKDKNNSFHSTPDQHARTARTEPNVLWRFIVTYSGRCQKQFSEHLAMRHVVIDVLPMCWNAGPHTTCSVPCTVRRTCYVWVHVARQSFCVRCVGRDRTRTDDMTQIRPKTKGEKLKTISAFFNVVLQGCQVRKVKNRPDSKEAMKPNSAKHTISWHFFKAIILPTFDWIGLQGWLFFSWKSRKYPNLYLKNVWQTNPNWQLWHCRTRIRESLDKWTKTVK